MTAAALFDTKFASTAMKIIVALRITGCGSDTETATSWPATKAAAPVFTSARDSAIAATVRKIMDESSARVASRHLRQPVNTISSTPTSAAIATGAMRSEAARMIIAMIASASGALRVSGTSVVASSTSSSPLRLTAAICAAGP